jgi:hypothetical protein
VSITTYRIGRSGFAIRAEGLEGPYIATQDYLAMVEKFSQQLGQQTDRIEELQRYRSYAICNDCGSHDICVPKELQK